MTDTFTTLKQFTVVFEDVLQIQRTMKMFDKFRNQFIVISFVFISICTIAFANFLYFEALRVLELSIGGIAECLSLLFIICYFSNNPNHNYNKLLDKIEELELKNTKASFEHKVFIDFSIVNRMYCIRKSLCFTAFGLYKITMKTFLSVMSLIITFSVILIQTE